MKCTKEVDYCKKFFYESPRPVVLALIEKSCLTDKEREIIYARYIEGLSIKEICIKLNCEEDAYKKHQKKILVKLYTFIQHYL